MRNFQFNRLYLVVLIFQCFCLWGDETKIYIVRHGQTAWNAEGKMQGKADIPLNALGRRQAEEVVDNFENICFATVYSSGLSRADETAEILAKKLALSVFVDNRFEEVSFGSWEGKSQKDFIAARSEEKQEIESKSVVLERVMNGLNALAEKYPNQNILVVSHGGIVKYLIEDMKGILPEHTWVRNLDYIVMTKCQGKWTISHVEQMILKNPQVFDTSKGTH